MGIVDFRGATKCMWCCWGVSICIDIFSFFVFFWWKSFLVVSLLFRICCIEDVPNFLFLCLDMSVDSA
jgi:hypothetical protein